MSYHQQLYVRYTLIQNLIHTMNKVDLVNIDPKKILMIYFFMSKS